MKSFLALISIPIFLLFVIVGCGGESEQEKYNRRKNLELGQRQQLEQLQEDAKHLTPEPAAEPEPKEEPTPIPRDNRVDIIYANGGKFSVTYGKADLSEGVVMYKTIEVKEDEEPQDVLWVMPGGALIVTEKYSYKVKKIN